MGPYTHEQVQLHLAKGSLLPTDLAWYEGLESWTQLSSISPKGANTSNLAMFGYVSATGILIGCLAWIFKGNIGKEFLFYLIISLVLGFLATGIILVRKKFDTIGKQLLAVFIFTVASMGLTFLIDPRNNENLKIIFFICNIGGILSLMTLVVLWFLEKIKMKFQ